MVNVYEYIAKDYWKCVYLGVGFQEGNKLVKVVKYIQYTYLHLMDVITKLNSKNINNILQLQYYVYVSKW